MIRKRINNTGKLSLNTSVEGESIEKKLQRAKWDGQSIDKNDTAPIIYTERKEGIHPGMNIRTDKWDVALDAADAISRSRQAKRDSRDAPMKVIKEGENGGTESTEGTGLTN